jgi:membrane protein YdbS with pleckstrin-like domain
MIYRYHMDSEHFPSNTPFKPSPSLVAWFNANFLILIFFILVFIFAPVVAFTDIPLPATLLVLGIIATFMIVFFIWVKLYYESMWYELHQDEMRWKRGVWFRSTGIVPYNRVTNIDIRQGPVMRALGISTISIQTAGYSGQAAPEIRIEAIEYPDELRELLRTMVRSCSSGGDGTGTGKTTLKTRETSFEDRILEELKGIRELLIEKL